ncbi:aKG-HExxH-type peptide beta-hydroxylase [Roseomonas sp. AR75]|uniref:aKG-HExxH-type peptide beta-hydroxylase n=1 Tax=Roseomonas sp. AR75 TaxID=2562311 RepID=UPI001F10E8C8|nr:HEXXH motif-containing putative peptide modification protein [Roseomonas sp. AR75]
MRARLAASLRTLAEAASGLIACDAAAIGALADLVAARPVRPAVMARYAEAMLAIGAGDAATAEAALAALADPALRTPALPRTVTLDDDDLGPGVAALYTRLLNDDPDSPVAIRALDAAERDAAPSRIAAALALLGPDFAGELASVAQEVVAVAAAPGGALHFQGATSFHLWGAIALNLPAHPTDAALAVTLAHESGHAVLFAQSFGAPLTANDPASRYASPLRETPRPMEGIVHATWVLARMHLAIERMLAGGAADAAAREALRAMRGDIRRDYAAGLAVVDAAARFTPEGEAAFAPAAAYMATAA